MTTPRKSAPEAHPSLAELAAALAATAKGDGYTARCLFPERHTNGDANPSMSLFSGRDGKPRLHCKVCGPDSTKELMAEAERRGLIQRNGNGTGRKPATKATPNATPRKSATKAPPPWERPVECGYEYPGAVKVRFADGIEPRFSWRRTDADGKTRWNRGDHVPALYRADALQEPLFQGAVILYVAGERDAETAVALGYHATCAPDGEGSLTPELAEPLRGAQVIVIPDADKPGIAHAKRAAAILADLAASVRMISLSGLDGSAERKDLSDWFARCDGTPDQLDSLLADAPTWKPEPVTPDVTACGEALEADYSDAPSEDALALAFTAHHGADLRHVSLWSQWFRWTGHRWERDSTLIVFDQCRAICRRAAAIAALKDSTRARIASAATVAAVERLAKADRAHAAPADLFDRDQFLIATPGGNILLEQRS